MTTKHQVNIYDFDHTIYRGDASRDFILYCMIRRPLLWKYAPRQAAALIGYVFGHKSRKQVKEEAFSFLQGMDDSDTVLEGFWYTHSNKVAPWYMDKRQAGDIIISASPEFLLAPMVNKLGLARLIATRMDPKTGMINGENCRAEEKLRRLKQSDTSAIINKVYSDSLSDRPLFELAKYPYIVRQGRIIPLSKYKPSRPSAFNDLAFLRFLIVGAVNSFFGIFLSFIIDLIISNPLPAFVVGFSLSLTISYFINAVVTFRVSSFSVRQYVKFCLSYVPNFVILVVAVYVFAIVLGLYSLIAYILAALVAAPLTFLLLSKFTFTSKERR